MKTKQVILAAIAALIPLTGFSIEKVKEVSGVYVGGHIRRERPRTITTLRESGFTYAILFNVDVKADGTLTTDGDTICYNGAYVFDKKHPYYVEDVKNLKTAPTSITRVEICIGGWGNGSYGNIRDLINKSGTGASTMLYKNFRALKKAIPEIDAVNNDQEQDYDQSTAVKFHVMMKKLGYKTTLAPYTYKSYWQSLLSDLNAQSPGACDRVMVQCYDGGAGNNPKDWHMSGVTLHAGLMYYSNDWSVEKNLTQFQSWHDECSVAGGFVWVYNSEEWNLNAWASGMNRVYGAMSVTEEERAATVYSEKKYEGYAVDLPVGRYRKGEMAVWGITANDIASVKVKPGYRISLYKTVGCTGTALKKSVDTQALSSTFINLVQSIIVLSDEMVVQCDSVRALNTDLYSYWKDAKTTISTDYPAALDDPDFKAKYTALDTELLAFYKELTALDDYERAIKFQQYVDSILAYRESVDALVEEARQMVTAIADVAPAEPSSSVRGVFTLDGIQLIDLPSRGIFIVDGKKVRK
ncbi:MAG: hypothetical protein HUK03_08545 [Bacteroidaceae bacterium]|nr:hypothetical protein [Bacteroidaceae bacterium]